MVDEEVDKEMEEGVEDEVEEEVDEEAGWYIASGRQLSRINGFFSNSAESYLPDTWNKEEDFG